MNNREAIAQIKGMRFQVQSSLDEVEVDVDSKEAEEDNRKIVEAFDMAIKALEQTDKDKTFAFLDGAGQGILAGLNIRKGTWIDTEPDKDGWRKSNNPWKCSCCGHRAGKDKYKTYKFCPWCGADMRGDNK